MDDQLSKLLALVVLYSHKCGQSPYLWNSETQMLTYRESRKWKLTKICFTPYLVFLLVRFSISIWKEKPTLLVFMLEVIYCLIIIISFIVHTLFIFFGHRFMNNDNSIFAFYNQICGKY